MNTSIQSCSALGGFWASAHLGLFFGHGGWHAECDHPCTLPLHTEGGPSPTNMALECARKLEYLEDAHT